ncbi:MAG: peptidylprolyl isomerase [Deltaproteobacteria bacterium]|nr:peptidylprolyl isomerase [Deltaproteobacteria bacterium]MBW2258486.1 peptidylprolyl isomerase [Deltaproteobacteria bacterium]
MPRIVLAVFTALLLTALPGSALSQEADPAEPHPALLDPTLAQEEAPKTFRVRFETTKGDFVVEVNRKWAKKGATRFYNLVRIGFYDDVAFFRVIDGFMVQFGIPGDPEVAAAWQQAVIKDDMVLRSNRRGRITFGNAGRHTRTTQVFINYTDRNAALDAEGFAPFGEVVEGMEVVDALYKGYGEGAPTGSGPKQGMIRAHGNAYLRQAFPELDYVIRARIVE